MTMIEFFSSLEVPCSFGRAAKIVAIYLKTAVVIPSGGKGEKAAIIHPPIDRILLTAIATQHKDVRLMSVPWTRLSNTDYEEIRRKILEHVGHFNWQTETFWNISYDKIEPNSSMSLENGAGN
ncbi:MAG: hypothetical protein EOP48_11375 [Sphingobacteriales bacterium]|nr:MAG: hypothetical protein EOP48_11375 [Sphingobacteriales bacterium]